MPVDDAEKLSFQREVVFKCGYKIHTAIATTAGTATESVASVF